MSQTRTTGWLAYTVTVAVAVALAAAVFVLVIILFYRWQHPEAIHGLLTICMMVVFFGGPAAALFGSVSLSAARRRNLAIPKFVRYAVYCAWGLAAIPATLILYTFAIALLR
jgi:hypothetical protein